MTAAKPTIPTKPRKRNPTDATLRNVRALKKRVARLDLQVADLMHAVTRLLHASHLHPLNQDCF